MNQAKVKLLWNPSVSTDVQVQNVVVAVNSETVESHSLLGNSISELNLEHTFQEGDIVHVDHVVNDGTHDSDAATLDFQIGDLTKPEAVTALGYEVTVVSE